jgi:hypothetical protein
MFTIFCYKWRAGKANDSLELFEGFIMSLYEKFKVDFKVATDYKIPFDEKDEKVEKTINELSASICSYKNTDGARHGVNGDNIDALNILLVETKRDGKNSSIFETKQFIVSTDQSLRRWDYYRNTVTPIVILPSQWLSILLRYINRSNDDFKSFVSFLNLPSGESQIDSEKIHIILAGISEMTENFDQQRFIVQSLVQKKFDGILEKGVKDDEILERTKAFAKTELEKKVEEIGSKHETLKSELDTHKQTTNEKIGGLEQKTSEQTQKLTAKGKEVEKLKFELKIKTVREDIKKWQRPVYFLIPFGLAIIVFTILQFCCKEWEFNISYKIITSIDTLESETQKNTLRALMYTPLKPTQFASTIKNRTSRHTTKVFNRACKADPKEKLFLKNFQRFKKNKTPDTQARQKSTRQMTQTDDIKMVVTHDRQERQPITAVWRNGGFSASYDSFVVRFKQ